MDSTVLLLFFLVFSLPHETFSADDDGRCNRECGDRKVPYPFGFSSGCPIPLSCDGASSTPMLFPLPRGNATTSTAATTLCSVVSFNSSASTVVVSLQPFCDRTVQEARAALSGPNYGVSARTGLFLGGGECRARRAPPNASACSVPAGVMTRLLRTAQCGIGNDTSAAAAGMACVASAAQNATAETFLSWDKAEKTKCDDLLTSAVYMDAEDQGAGGSLEFGVAELGWWLNGTCAAAAAGSCAANATCTDVRTPGGTAGHRCACVAGLDGDGFFAGDGCYVPPSVSISPRWSPLPAAGLSVIVFLVSITIVACFLLCRRKMRNARKTVRRLAREATVYHDELGDNELDQGTTGPRRFSYHELAAATNKFCDDGVLGKGGFGSVYRGFHGGMNRELAVKRVSETSRQGWKEFVSEVRIISRLRHRNLVQLIGWCHGDEELLLVYDLMHNGSLDTHLYATESVLAWSVSGRGWRRLRTQHRER